MILLRSNYALTEFLLDKNQNFDSQVPFNPSNFLFMGFTAQTSAVVKNFGGLRECVACSKAYANFSSAGSLHARPKNEMPTGNPKTNPAGTVMLGYPATAAMVELPPIK